MSLVLATLQLVFCGSIAVYEYKKKSIGVFLWAILLVIFAIPHFLGIVSNVNEYSEEILLQASLFFLAFQTIYMLTRIIVTRNVSKYALTYNENDDWQMNNEVTKVNFSRYFKISILVLLIFMVYFIVSFGKIFGFSWGQVYQASINNTSLIGKIMETLKDFNLIIYFSATGLLFASYMAKKRYHTIILTLIILYYTLATQNRIGILPLIVSIIAIFIYKHKKISIKQVIVLVFIGMVTVYSVYGILIFRHTGSIEKFREKYNFSSLNEEIINSIVNGEGELGLRNYFYYFISINNEFPGLGEGATYLRILLMFIPTKLSFGLKPSDFAITMSSAYTGDINNTNYSIHPTFLGDAYANFSWFGILLGFVWALFIYFLDKYINKKDYIPRTLLTVVWGTALIIIGRGSVYNGVYIGVTSTIIVCILNLFRNKKFVISK